MTSQPEQHAPKVPSQPRLNNMCSGYKAIMKPMSNGNICIGYTAGYALAPLHIPKSKTNRFIHWLDRVIERWLTA